MNESLRNTVLILAMVAILGIGILHSANVLPVIDGLPRVQLGNESKFYYDSNTMDEVAGFAVEWADVIVTLLVIGVVVGTVVRIGIRFNEGNDEGDG